MAYKVLFSIRAKADMAAAFDYLAEQAPEAASRWYNFVMGEIASLGEMPARCPIAPESREIGAEFRHLLCGRYRIVFRILEDRKAVDILAVHHGARKPLAEEDIQPVLDATDPRE